MTIYAIGDLHGQTGQLDAALARVGSDGGDGAQVVFLGDYTDRGPDSRGVLDRLIRGRDAGRPWRFLRGNHDRMFLRFVTEGVQNDPAIRSGKCWFNAALGGLDTLASYGIVPDRPPLVVDDPATGLERLVRFEFEGRSLPPEGLAEHARRVIPRSHLDLLAETELMVETPDAVFVHAGIRPGVPLSRQIEDDLIWIRAPFLEDDSDHGPLIIHGHTVVEKPSHMGNRVALDTGAGYGRPITVARVTGRDVHVVEEHGARLLRPPR